MTARLRRTRDVVVRVLAYKGALLSVVFLAVMVFTGAISTSLPAYLQAAMLPGLLAALAQVVLLPLLAHVWVTRAHR